MGNSNIVSSRYRSSSFRSSLKTITPLYEACRDGNEEDVRNLIPNYSHAELNRQEFPYGGNTCLHVAAANGHDSIVKILLEHGCYRSSCLNAHNQSAYDIAVANKESTRLLFIRQDENDPSFKSTSRFYDQDVNDCFEIVRVEDEPEKDKKPSNIERRSAVQTYKNEEEKQHEIEYSASSKAMCQSRLGRFCVNRIHDDEPLDQHTINEHLNNLLVQIDTNHADDYIKADELLKKYKKNWNSVEQLLHLYTLETQVYRLLKQDCLPLALPLFVHLPKLKERYFQGRVYRGMHMTHEQFLIYHTAMEMPGTLLETRSFSSTTVNRLIAEQFAYFRSKKNEKDVCVLFIFDFPEICDQAINLSRISINQPCLSEYEEEQEVLILPWTLFEVTRVRKGIDEDDISTIHLTNVIIPKKKLLSTFKWTWIELKNQLTKEKKLKLDCAFQKHKTQLTINKDD